MGNIYNTISDPMYLKELIDSYETENMNQWLLYMGEGGLSYYNSKNKHIDNDEILSYDDFYDFSSHCFKEGEKTAFISLGCGNSETEKYILNKLPDNYDVSYIGVDTSKEMLQLSIDNLKSLDNNKVFLRADFGSDEFKNEINNLCRGYDKKVFAFFGGTFGNIKYTKIINILYNILGENDKIWIDIGIRKGSKIGDDLELFDIYKGYLTNEGKRKFLLSKIKNDGINTDNGEIIIESDESKENGALKFSFYFQFNKKTEIHIKNYNIIFLPGYKLKLLQIYRFDPEGFVNMFNGHQFNLVEKQIKGYDGQFLFKKR